MCVKKTMRNQHYVLSYNIYIYILFWRTLLITALHQSVTLGQQLRVYWRVDTRGVILLLCATRNPVGVLKLILPPINIHHNQCSCRCLGELCGHNLYKARESYTLQIQPVVIWPCNANCNERKCKAYAGQDTRLFRKGK